MCLDAVDDVRYIPTSVGRFHPDHLQYRPASVHPHVCGEIPLLVLFLNPLFGTSPRLWGDSPRAQGASRKYRYIPTSVGRFLPPLVKWVMGPVHPHVCGEIAVGQNPPTTESGTSPRLWGDFFHLLGGSGGLRYIPTSVGRLIAPRYSPMDAPVHPHVCGEIVSRDVVIYRIRGTSPRLWGDCPVSCIKFVQLRYIPTSVGRF